MQTAFIFPGQGSQSIAMMSEFYTTFSYTKALTEEANDILGYNLWQIISTDDANTLNKTIYTQPAMLLADVISLEVIQRETNITPSMVAGHSLGEIAALVAAKVVNFADAITLVDKRARLMQECVAEGVGSMAAIIGLDNESVIAICDRCSTNEDIVEAVNFNAPAQVVIAGNTTAVNRACEVCRSQGAKRALVLAVSIPSHSSLMQPIGEEFLACMDNIPFVTPAIDLFHNVDAKSTDNTTEIKAKLARQLHNPVRWVDIISHMHNRGASLYIEVGPGKVLTGLNKRINKALTTYGVFDNASLATVSELAVP